MIKFLWVIFLWWFVIFSTSLFGAQTPKNYNPEIIKEWINFDIKIYKGFSLNKGQIDKQVLLYSKNGDFNIYLTQKGLSFLMFATKSKEEVLYSRIDYDLIGANIKRENIILEDEIENYYENYYNENAPDGILFVKLYGKVRIKEIYPKIDLILKYDENGNFHYEFEANPNSNIAQIKIEVKNAQIEPTDEGKSILLKTPLGIMKDGNLIAYEGNKVINAKYLINNNLLSFDVKNYENRDKLLIDPYTLVWSTYYGGSNYDHANYIASDPSSNIFVVGWTLSSNFPTYNPGNSAYFQGTLAGSYDAFILKFNNNGVRLWATYYGGSNYDFATSAGADANGNVFVVGGTFSTNFPTYNPGGSTYYDGTCGTDGNCNYDPTYGYKNDAFILKFDNNGVRLWATYYGGSSWEWECGTSGTYSASAATYDYCSLKVDRNNNLIVVGMTMSFDFPIYNPGGGAYYQTCHNNDFDAFILKFSNSGQLLWATCYGGSNWDYARSVDVDGANNIFVVGFKVYSSDFPTYNPGGGAYYQTCSGIDWDVFILKFNSSGVRLWATCYGGSNHEWADGVAVDNNGKVYVIGGTWSTDFPTLNPGGGYYFDGTLNSGDAFILRFNNSGVLEWATYYGGSGDEANTQHSITTDGSGIYIVGNTTSTDFPTYNPGGGAYYQSSLSGGRDAFISVFNNGQVLWSTYFGGSGDECYNFNCHLAIAGNNLFVVGSTVSSNFPLQNLIGAYYQGNLTGFRNAFISKFSNITPTSIYESFISFIKIQNNQVIIKLNENLSGNYKVYTILGREITSGEISNNEISFAVPNSGIYIIKVKNKQLKIIVK